jgi:competence protein ComEC
LAKIRRGCAPAVFLIILVVGSVAGFFGWRWYKQMQPPPASGGELIVQVLDVGQGDAILILGPEDKETKKRQVVLVDAGDQSRDKKIVEALNKASVDHIDLFIATHAHADHIGGADAVIKAKSATTVLHNDLAPPSVRKEAEQANAGNENKKPRAADPKKRDRSAEFPTVKTYRDLLDATTQMGAKVVAAQPGQTFEIGGGAVITVLAPHEPFFEAAGMRGGGNVPNANSIVCRLDYGDFSMLLPGDAEAQTEERLLQKESRLQARILKVAHHGSKYATSESYLTEIKPEVAIISAGEYNRYGHPSQVVLDRLKAANVKVYRTDYQGTVTITTTGKPKDGKLYQIKTEKEAKADLWVGREAEKSDTQSSGFISYGEFGPPPKPRRERTERK